MFITFEGTEGCGKSTLMTHIAEELKTLGIPIITTREPGGSRVSEAIRNVLLHENMDPLTELFLYESARAEHYKTVLAPAIKNGFWILCDRYTDSTIAYQGFARGLPLPLIEKLNSMATQKLKPNLTFFLDLPVAEGLSRAKDPNRFEREGVKFQNKVRKGFLYCIKKNKKRFRILKVKNKTPEQVCESAMKHLEPFL